MTYNIQEDIYLCLISIVAFFLTDQAFKVIGWFPKDRTARYLSLHVICNSIVTVMAFRDTALVYFQPIEDTIMAASTDTKPCMIIAALHIYHILMCKFQLPMVDWVHHILMVVITLPLAYSLQPGPLLNHGAWFASGFPGGTDYVMLVCVKKGWMDTMTEKEWNSSVQTWIRNPGMLYHCLLTWMGYCYVRSDPKIWEAALGKACFTTELGFQIGVFFTMVSYYWNGPYFQARVVDNFARKDYPIKFLKKVRKKYGENSKEYAAALSSNELLKKESKRGPSDLKPTSTSFPYNELKKQAASANCVDGGDSPERKTSKKRN